MHCLLTKLEEWKATTDGRHSWKLGVKLQQSFQGPGHLCSSRPRSAPPTWAVGKQLEGELAASTESAGLDRTDGSTRSLIVQQREGLRHEVLTLALQRHSDRLARPVTVFQNFDKLSGAWLLRKPGPETGLSAKIFTEAMAAHLCLPLLQ